MIAQDPLTDKVLRKVSLLQLLALVFSAFNPGARSKFWGGCQGRRTGVGVTTISNSIILGGWVTKVLKNGDKK